ncbi:hypothetical protein [Paenibacillus bovis]|uniref:Uncharacterized protein n=1 Tax=Paenibacillus bovis TaxID=1616788 RepID=A0A172ZIX5_9BACL|nr:hypothetical protein [Paenibacillus bovis]ANF97227.1 hypothetical protein AR543_15285 [Paenibacillus bovis]
MDKEVRQRLITICEMHISNLEEQLRKLYTIENPLRGSDVAGGEIIDVRVELEICRRLEEIYQRIDIEGTNEGETYDMYHSYFFHTTKAREVFESRKLKLELQHAAEIKNINLLLEGFIQEMSRLHKE